MLIKNLFSMYAKSLNLAPKFTVFRTEFNKIFQPLVVISSLQVIGSVVSVMDFVSLAVALS